MKKQFPLFGKKIELPLILLCAGGVVMTALMVVSVMSWIHVSAADNLMSDMDARLGRMEKRLAVLGDIEKTMAWMDEQTARLELFMARYDRFEATTSMRLDTLESGPGKAPDRGAAAGGAPETAAETAEPIQPTGENPALKNQMIHTVQKNETLYAISRRYGTTPDELLRLNPDLKKGKIFPGQKIRVRDDDRGGY